MDGWMYGWMEGSNACRQPFCSSILGRMHIRMAYNLFRQTPITDSYWQWDEVEDDPPPAPQPSLVPIPIRLCAPKPPLPTPFSWAISILLRRHLEGHGPPIPRSIPLPFNLGRIVRPYAPRKPRPLPCPLPRIRDFPRAVFHWAFVPELIADIDIV